MILKAYAMEQSKDQIQFNSVQFSHSVMSNSLWSHESQHARPPCPSLTPGFYSNSCPLSWWCHPTISVTWSQLIPRGTQDDQCPWWCRRTIKEIERNTKPQHSITLTGTWSSHQSSFTVIPIFEESREQTHCRAAAFPKVFIELGWFRKSHTSQV